MLVINKKDLPNVLQCFKETLTNMSHNIGDDLLTVYENGEFYNVYDLSDSAKTSEQILIDMAPWFE